MNILVLAGGLSSERNVSLSSGAMVTAALRGRGHRAALVDLFLGLQDYGGTPAEIFDNPPPLPDVAVTGAEPDLNAVRALRRDGGAGMFGPGVLEVCGLADVVFLALHGDCGEDGRVQAAFDLLAIPYTGSGYLGSAIAMDKDLTKRLVAPAGIPTPPWRTVELGSTPAADLAEGIGLPCVVKVPNGGSSIGVYLCHTRTELETALESCRAAGRAVIEAYVKGREFSCGVLDGRSLPPIEIIPAEGFYDYHNKYQKGAAREVCPAEIPPELAARMEEYALAAHKLLGLSAYSRSDFLLEEETGQVWFLEINTLPGMTPTSLLPQEAAAVGVDYGALCQTIVDLALAERWR